MKKKRVSLSEEVNNMIFTLATQLCLSFPEYPEDPQFAYLCFNKIMMKLTEDWESFEPSSTYNKDQLWLNLINVLEEKVLEEKILEDTQEIGIPQIIKVYYILCELCRNIPFQELSSQKEKDKSRKKKERNKNKSAIEVKKKQKKEERKKKSESMRRQVMKENRKEKMNKVSQQPIIDRNYMKFIKEKHEKINSQIRGEQLEYYLKLRDQKINYIKHIHKMVQKLEKEKLEELQNEQVKDHLEKNEEFQLRIKKLDDLFSQNMIQIKGNLKKRKQVFSQNKVHEVNLCRAMEESIKLKKEKEMKDLKRIYEVESNKLKGIIGDEVELKNKILKIHKKHCS